MTTPSELANLAFRLETAEAAACEAKLRGLEAYDPKANRYEVTRMGRTFLFSAPMSRRNSSYNRALVFSSSDSERLDDILRWLRERDAYWFDVAPVLVDAVLVQALVDDGLHVSSLANALCMAPVEVANQPSPGMVIQEVDLQDPGQLREFGTVVYHGRRFPKPLVEAMQRVERSKYADPTWHTYLAALGSEPAALAALHISDGVATIGDLDAIPGHRGRGCRRALLLRCISDATCAECEWIASRTNPSSELEKVMTGAGFEIVYTKRLYSRESRAHYDQ